jgi:enamine deaminase RidA (YjgF/YER057c/UK114 family)
MDVEHLVVPGEYDSGSYSHAVRVGNLLFCSGISARQPDGSVHTPGDPTAQARYCFERLKRLLAQAGCTYKDVIKITTYLTRYEHRAAVGAVRREYVSPPLPASTGVVVSSLSDPELLFEVEAVAVIPDAH